MSGFWHFLQYHNAIPITLGIIFLGSGAALAASPEVRSAVEDTVYSSESTVISVDNTYIANKDFANYTPSVQIVDVTEDEEWYFIAYVFRTIDVVDHVWQDIEKNETMKVSKADLGAYRDLGVYVTEQLKQKIDRELAYLEEVQSIERKNISQKTVATAYSGLVGAFLDDTVETLPGYTPVVTERPERAFVPTADVRPSQGSAQNGASTPVVASSPKPSGAPVVQILGENPVRVSLRNIYVDLGVVVSDDKDANFLIHTFVNDEEVERVEIETALPSEWTIRYEVTDSDGNIGSATRKVVVYDPAQPSSQTAPSAPGPVVEPTSTQETATTTPAEETNVEKAEEPAAPATTTEEVAPPAQESQSSATTTTPTTTASTTTPAAPPDPPTTSATTSAATSTSQ